MKRKAIFVILAGLVLVGLLASIAGCPSAPASHYPLHDPLVRFRIATTTSLYDTGLWYHLEPIFEELANVEMDIIYAGTGIALEYGRRGDVDAIIVHDRAREDEFLADGYGINRRNFAYNFFLIAGPESDPAGIAGSTATEAFQKMYNAGLNDPNTVKFVSRGDDSGTHAKEKLIWSQAGFDYEDVRNSGKWYVEAGKGMGPTLLMASELGGYTLTDMGTFLSYKSELELVPLVDKGDILLNVYSAIAINPESNPKTNIEMANNLIDFLTSPQIQELIGNYGVEKYGMPLFTPCAGAEPTS